jgi:lysozyme
MTKITKIGPNGLALIKKFEGFSSKPYNDPASGGLPITIGWGSTRYADGTKVTLKDPAITKEQADILFLQTIKQYELAVDAFCRDDINQNQFDSLVSFAYNLGVNALKTSTLLKKVNANPNDVVGIAQQFNKWVNANGKPLKGLILRRAEEAELFFKE